MPIMPPSKETLYDFLDSFCTRFLNGGDILFIVPPFGSINDIAFGPHLLQALAVEEGYKADILYLNLLLAAVIGVKEYENIYFSPEYWMLGERLFARCAHGLPPLGKDFGSCIGEAVSIRESAVHVPHPFDPDAYLQSEDICCSFVNEVIPHIASAGYRIVGCTASMTRQTNCGFALLSGIKKHSPGAVTIIGGSSCRSEMAGGIASLGTAVDYIFSGESETAFLDFLKGFSSHQLPPQRIIPGMPFEHLDRLPLVNYDFYFDQYSHCLGEEALKKANIWYETSRGCWWGQQSPCTFCSEHQTPYRQKSAQKVIHELEEIGKRYPGKIVLMADIVMPRSYREELLPVIAEKKESPRLGYQVRVSPGLEELVNLKKAKIEAVLPGIETFSTPLLDLMNKGITAGQSLLFLRSAACAGIYTDWLLLWGIPGDKISYYEEVLRLLPLVRHLQPPRSFFPMILMRFSPYLLQPREYKIDNLRPWAVFREIYPDGVDIDKLAVYYTGDYPCESLENPGIIREIAGEIAAWRKTWKQSTLEMNMLMDTFFINDNRGILEKPNVHRLDYAAAREIMVSRDYDENSAKLKWAVEEKLGVVVDSRYIPLVTAPAELLLEFEKKA
jgi:ribosomal peptide maturation radical SAM protein 1